MSTDQMRRMGPVGPILSPPAVATERYAVRGMTCGSCTRHVEQALGALPGVRAVTVDLATGTATLRRDPAAASREALADAVAAAGYTLEDAAGPAARSLPSVPLRPLAFGLLAALGLLGFYLGTLTWAQGWGHATQQLADDRWFVLVIMAGFGTQIGLFTSLRQLHARATAGVAAASTGTSTAAMLACCAHHLVDVLPVLGLAGAAAFLGAYRTELLWLGIAINLVGVAYMAVQVRRARRLACEVPGPSSSKAPAAPASAACH